MVSLLFEVWIAPSLRVGGTGHGCDLVDSWTESGGMISDVKMTITVESMTVRDGMPTGSVALGRRSLERNPPPRLPIRRHLPEGRRPEVGWAIIQLAHRGGGVDGETWSRRGCGLTLCPVTTEQWVRKRSRPRPSRSFGTQTLASGSGWWLAPPPYIGASEESPTVAMMFGSLIPRIRTRACLLRP